MPENIPIEQTEEFIVAKFLIDTMVGMKDGRYGYFEYWHSADDVEEDYYGQVVFTVNENPFEPFIDYGEMDAVSFMSVIESRGGQAEDHFAVPVGPNLEMLLCGINRRLNEFDEEKLNHEIGARVVALDIVDSRRESVTYSPGAYFSDDMGVGVNHDRTHALEGFVVRGVDSLGAHPNVIGIDIEPFVQAWLYKEDSMSPVSAKDVVAHMFDVAFNSPGLDHDDAPFTTADELRLWWAY